jgi:hypothetical protein
MAGPTRSKETENPQNSGIESFSMRNNFCAWAVVDAATSSARLITSLEIDVEMFVLVIIIDG